MNTVATFCHYYYISNETWRYCLGGKYQKTESHWPNVDLMLDLRLRRLTNITPTSHIFHRSIWKHANMTHQENNFIYWMGPVLWQLIGKHLPL